MSEVVATCVEYKRHLAKVAECTRRKMVDPRCKNHEGGRFLTITSWKTAIMGNVPQLGLVGSYLFHRAMRTTLAASPLICTGYGSNKVVTKYTTFAGYDVQFNALCRSTRNTEMVLTEEVKNFVGVNNTSLSLSRQKYGEFMSLFGAGQAEVNYRYSMAVNTLGQTEPLDA